MRHRRRTRCGSSGSPSRGPSARDRLAREHGIAAGHVFADWRELLRRGRLRRRRRSSPPRTAMHVEPAVRSPSSATTCCSRSRWRRPRPSAAASPRRSQRHGVIFAVCHVLRYTALHPSAQASCSPTGRIGDAGQRRSTSSRSAGGTRRTRSCAATGAARTSRRRCCWPSRATTWTGCATSSAARALEVARSAAWPTSAASERPAGAADRCLDCAGRADLPVLGASGSISAGLAARARPAGRVRRADRRPTADGVTAALRDGPVRPLRVRLRQRRGRPPGRQPCSSPAA